MVPHDPMPQTASGRAALAGDAASQALNDALRVSFLILKVAMLAVAVVFFLTGLYRVRQYEEAIVLRFGRIVTYTDDQGQRTARRGPGLHFAWPFLIDEILRFPVESVLEERIDAFWYKEREGDAPGSRVPPGIKPGDEGFTLTGDANILHSKWIVHYRVTDPVKFCEGLADPSAKRIVAVGDCSAAYGG